MHHGTTSLNDPRLIVFYGSADTGKTTILTSLIEVLKSRSSNYKEIKKGAVDRCSTFDYGNYRIGICTAGDSKKQIQENINFLKTNNCNVWIMASRQPFKKSTLRGFSFCEILDLSRCTSVEDKNDHSKSFVRFKGLDELMWHIRYLVLNRRFHPNYVF